MFIPPAPLARRALAAVTALFLATLASLAVAACSDDDDSPDPTPAGSLVTTTPTQPAAASQPTQGATLVPGSPSATPPAQGPTPAVAGEAVMLDMVPCGTAGESLVQTAQGVPALTYKNVPEGTPILFPFEKGDVRHVDARQGAILIVYDVEGVGVFSVQAAGTETLDRLVSHPTAGTVIGHFPAHHFEDEETHVFHGHQLFAVVGTTEVRLVGNQPVLGEPLLPRVEDCITLP